MFESLLISAVVVVPHTPAPPPPPPTPSSQVQQVDCEYSAMVGGTRDAPVYQCFSQAEWDARNAQIAADAAREQAEFENYIGSELPSWWRAHWWKVLLWMLGAFVLLVIVGLVTEAIDKKRHPWRYDEFGLRKDWRI